MEKAEANLAAAFSICRGDPTRTGDHLVPNQVRYQLRYTPKAFLLKSVAKVVLFLELTKLIDVFFTIKDKNMDLISSGLLFM